METEVRRAAFSWLNEKIALYGETLPRDLLAGGFTYNGIRVTLIGPSGIWKPKNFELAPISITSIVGSPYDDALQKMAS